jgi:DNA-directed RNA polymerase subunit RPC12/RpoP/ribosomal protein L40E
VTISFSCDGCGKRFTVGDQAAGKTGKCPGCGGKIVAPALPIVGQSRVIAVKESAEIVQSRSMPSEPSRHLTEYKACLYCGESILVNAIKCRYCGEMLDERLRTQVVPQHAAPIQQPPQYFPQPAQPIVHVPLHVNQHTHIAQHTQVIVHKVPFNHLLHFVLTVITCGAWFPVWIIMWLCH